MLWKRTKEQLVTFTNKLNKKHKTIKFEYKMPLRKIPLLNRMV